MHAHFNDPQEQAIYRYLLGGGAPATAGGTPTPASVPRRRPGRPDRPSAADIARAEGLDLGLDHPAPRPARPSAAAVGRPGTPRARRGRPAPTTQQAVLDLILREYPRLPRTRAVETAARWARAARGPAEAAAWIERIGWQHPQHAEALSAHGITPDMLDIPVDGIPTRTRLRSGESAGSIIAALRSAGA